MDGSTSTSSESGSGTIDTSSTSPDFDITCKHEPAIPACANEKHEEALSTPKESFPTQDSDVDLLSTCTSKSSVTTTTLEPTGDTIASSSEVNTTPDNTGNTDSTDIQTATPIHPISAIDDTIVSATLPPSPISATKQHSDAQPLATDQTEAISGLSQDDDNQIQEPVQGTFSEGYNKQEFSARLSALNVNIDTTESGMALPSSSSSPPSATSFSSSSSLSEFLLIGRTEREDSEFDRHSEQSFESHDSFGERYNETLDTSNLSQSSTNSSTSEPSIQRESHRQNHRHSRVCDEEYEQYSNESFQDYHRHKSSKSPEPPKERNTASNSESSSSFRFDRPSSPTNSERTRKRRSHRASPPPEDSHVAPAPSPMLPPLPALKLPSVRGIAKSMVELVIATVVCVSLVGAMFAFSYVSTGTKHLLGWYSDQRFGQRIRERIREREHFVQEALEKMAGEEYVKIKRRSRAGQQQYSYASSGNQYNRQQHYQDQQQQQNEQPYERESLSNAEWQELIRAASMSFMAKFSPPSGRR
ncbi:hypothetical protein BG006_003425 [Podila minutissima]|uniref:Uncharacterized protein n=1 Tax=Podila minutissima TaxID=64525 RepID=A0A9P5SQH6_9FUNG|nr:hypothetical protein BG006_003425 [Podila minutissima]